MEGQPQAHAYWWNTFEHMGNWFPDNKFGVTVWNPAAYNNTSSAGAFTGFQWNSINSQIPKSGFPNRSFFIEPRFGSLTTSSAMARP